MQLTGHRLSDFTISGATKLDHLYQALQRKPEPKKLANSEQFKQLRVNVPNVTTHSSKITLVKKETAIGRWKVIEGELLQRGLLLSHSRWTNVRSKKSAQAT